MAGADTQLFRVLAFVLIGSCWCQEEGPVWINTLEAEMRAGVPEDTKSWTELGRLEAVSASDNPGNSIIYATHSTNIVSVNGETGVVLLNAGLNRERNAEHNITFFAFDTVGGAASQVTVTMVVLDVNDNPPEFLNAPYTVTVNEMTPNRTVVYDQISVTDADIGENAEVTLSCTPRSSEDEFAVEACRMFSIVTHRLDTGVTKGVVSLEGSLSYQRRDTYTLEILAQNEGGSQSSRQTVTILVQENNQELQLPTFLNGPLRLSIYENRDDASRQIQARAGNIGSSLVLGIKSDPSNYFTMGETMFGDGVYSAVIQTSGMLDREALDDGIYSFTVEATESREGFDDLRSEAVVTVEVIDVNDNAPRFSQDEYVISLREDESGEGLLPDVFRLTDQDTGDNSYLSISLVGEGAEYFAVTPNAITQQGDIQLKVIQPPDYDDGTHQIVLTMIARETETAEQMSASTVITINVEDVNDNDPRFSMTDYTEYVREDRLVDYKFATITASDLDASFGVPTYSLSGDGSEMFGVNELTGEIYVAQALDFESQNVYSLIYTATDSGGRGTSVPLNVEVLDFNDRAPVFQQDIYVAFANESSTVLNPNITVKAVDQESDEDVTYTIIGGNPNGVATIGRLNGVIQLTRPLSYEETDDGILTLRVEASDNGIPPQSSTVPVTITVRDENNHSPVFANASYTRTIVETAPGNTPVVTVQASDLDSGTNGRLMYIIAAGARDNFVINPRSGLISVAESANLDIDVFDSNYDISVYAVDQGSPQRTATARVYITVLEANNKDPKFFLDIYTFTVMETVSESTLVDMVVARDPDDDSLIRYSIQPGSVTAKNRTGKAVTSTDPIDYRNLFRIDPVTGGIHTNGKLNRDHVAEVSFVVQAEDINGETTQRQLGTADVIITIRSTVDNDLKFSGPWSSQNPVISVTIPEEEPAGILVTTVIATDPLNAQQVRDYRKEAGTDPQQFFTLDRETGQVRLNKRMDFENPNTAQKSFRVVAFTSGPNVRSAMATITVTTTDINDHDPKFVLPSYKFDVSEGLNSGERIGVVEATDEDTGGIKYSISGQGSNVFTIHPDSGNIEVSEDYQLDRETEAVYYLSVRATDQGGKYTEIPLQITVMDENDNGPQFTSPEYNMYTLENVGRLTSLGQVHANDDDIGANGLISYRITNGNEPTNFDGITLGDLFTVDSSTGIIRSREDMAGYARDYPYSLTVEAQDSGSPSKKLTTIVQIHVDDVTRRDGRPKIDYPAEDGEVVTVPENTSPGINITQIRASDPDLGVEGQLEMGFVPNEALAEDHSFFNIDTDTGLITIKNNLDRELKETYELLIYVRDQDVPPNTVTRKIVVRVSDINDNSPTFNNDACPDLDIEGQKKAVVQEGVPIKTKVTTVTACDPDVSPNNKMYYYILSDNDMDPESTAFSMNMESGEISTNSVIDRETISQYKLCIYASDTPNLDNADIRELLNYTHCDEQRVNKHETLLLVVIDVGDVNDNGPVFKPKPGEDDVLIQGLPSNLPYGSDITQMVASDADSDPDFKYSIEQITFTDYRQQEEDMGINHFIIDENTGLIRTGKENYEKYRGGLFTVTVHATDAERKMASKELLIYVLSPGQRLKFSFSGTPQSVNSWYKEFFDEMNKYLSVKEIMIKADTLQHGIDSEGKAIYNKTDVCFHMLQNNQVISQHRANDILDDLKNEQQQVSVLYEQRKMLGLDACEPHVTTMWWSGWWWLWWLLIAFALFIILVTIIVIIVICCCWPKVRSPYAYPNKPYIVYDPGNQAPPNYGFEWQEQVVKMN